MLLALLVGITWNLRCLLLCKAHLEHRGVRSYADLALVVLGVRGKQVGTRSPVSFESRTCTQPARSLRTLRIRGDMAGGRMACERNAAWHMRSILRLRCGKPAGSPARKLGCCSQHVRMHGLHRAHFFGVSAFAICRAHSSIHGRCESSHHDGNRCGSRILNIPASCGGRW